MTPKSFTHRMVAAGATLLLLGVQSCILPASKASKVAKDAPGGSVRVEGLMGRVQFSRGGGPFTPVAPGTQLQATDVVRTTPGAAVDLFFRELPGTIRLTESTAVSIDKLAPAGKTVEVELTLQSGELLTQCKTLPTGARLEVKTGIGIAQVLSGEVRVQSRGYLVVTKGKAIFAHVPAGGQPTAHTLSAPPACYFTPSAGVQPAPRELVREVTDQLRAKLPK